MTGASVEKVNRRRKSTQESELVPSLLKLLCTRNATLDPLKRFSTSRSYCPSTFWSASKLSANLLLPRDGVHPLTLHLRPQQPISLLQRHPLSIMIKSAWVS